MRMASLHRMDGGCGIVVDVNLVALGISLVERQGPIDGHSVGISRMVRPAGKPNKISTHQVILQSIAVHCCHTALHEYSQY
jgi:hypothetical protein